MKIFEWVKSRLPFTFGDRVNATSQAKDLSRRTLYRFGRALNLDEIDLRYVGNYTEVKELYLQVAELGREKLLELVNYLGVGKLSIEALMSREWTEILSWENCLDYRNIFRPLAEDEIDELKTNNWLINLK